VNIFSSSSRVCIVLYRTKNENIVKITNSIESCKAIKRGFERQNCIVFNTESRAELF